MSNLAVRVITAVVGLPLILAVLYLGPPAATAVLIGLTALFAAKEFFALTHARDGVGRVAGVGLTLGLYTFLVVTRLGEQHPRVALFACLVLPFVALAVALARPGDMPSALAHAAALVFGPLYLGGAHATLALLRTGAPGHEGPGLVLLAMAVAWLGDTGGYFAGRGFKGPKLYPAVSPNKTWSGSVGGVAGSVLGALVLHHVTLPSMVLPRGLLVAAFAGALGQVGDLCESVLKRSAGVKDSGALLPGHGGILDRVDALLFVAPALYLALQLGWLRG